jgi:hypothetical protein
MPYPILPYRKYAVPAVSGMIEDYVCEPGTYYDLSSGAAPAEDFKDHTHLLFCLIEKLLEHISWIEGWLQMVRFGRRESLWQGEFPPRIECPNAWKARKQGKKDKLNRAREAMAMMQKVIGAGSFSEVMETASRQLRSEPFSTLTVARPAKFLTPHNWKFALL